MRIRRKTPYENSYKSLKGDLMSEPQKKKHGATEILYPKKPVKEIEPNTLKIVYNVGKKPETKNIQSVLKK